MANPQWGVRLDSYPRFVVTRLKGVLGDSRSEVIQSMVRQWISDHPDQVIQAQGSIGEWRAASDEGKGDQNEDDDGPD